MQNPLKALGNPQSEPQRRPCNRRVPISEIDEANSVREYPDEVHDYTIDKSHPSYQYFYTNYSIELPYILLEVLTPEICESIFNTLDTGKLLYRWSKLLSDATNYPGNTKLVNIILNALSAAKGVEQIALLILLYPGDFSTEMISTLLDIVTDNDERGSWELLSSFLSYTINKRES